MPPCSYLFFFLFHLSIHLSTSPLPLSFITFSSLFFCFLPPIDPSFRFPFFVVTLLSHPLFPLISLTKPPHNTPLPSFRSQLHHQSIQIANHLNINLFQISFLPHHKSNVFNIQKQRFQNAISLLLLRICIAL